MHMVIRRDGLNLIMPPRTSARTMHWCRGARIVRVSHILRSILVLGCLVPIQDLRAQSSGIERETPRVFTAAAGLGIGTLAREPANLTTLTTHQVTQAPESASKFVVTGALVGVALYGAGLAIYFSQSSSEFVGNPVALLLPAVGAAGLGALAGWLFYKARSN